MADELNIPIHRWYEPRNNISLPNSDFSKQWIYDSGIQKIDRWINSQPWGNPINALFALNEPGVWFDPSDLTTLFQDPAGTTAVTAPGNTVGLMLDKSKGLALGAELVANGDFSGGTTGWTAQGGATLSVDAGRLKVVTTATSQGASQVLTGLVLGKTYKFSIDVTTGGADWNTLLGIAWAQGQGFTSGQLSTSRTYSLVYTHTNPAINVLSLFSYGAGTTYYDNISVRELAGNHATQGITAARPTYSIEPVGGRRNIYNYSEDFSNAYWGKGNLTATATSINETATNTTHQLTSSSGTNTANVPNTLSFEVKPNGRSHINVAWANSGSHFAAFSLSGSGSVLSNQTAGIGTIALLPDGYYRITYTNTPTIVGATFYSINLADGAYPTTPVPSYLGDVTKGVLIRNAQLELGSTATAYQRVTTQHDVTEAGVASVGYLYFDGASDNMVTSTITPGTDKAQVFAGVRKLAAGRVVETSLNADTNNGSLYVQGNSTNYEMQLRGDTTFVYYNPATFNSPITNVVSCLFDIAGALRADEVKPRIDGVLTQTGGAGTSSGGGNFLAYPLYIGSRAGSLAFLNGHLYSLITRFGPTLDAPTITSTEIWVGDKTGIDVAKNISTTIYTRSGDTILDRANSTIERRAV